MTTLFNREAIYAALFARAAAATWAALGADGVTTFRASSRKLEHWTNVAMERLPYLGQAQRRETITRARGEPPKWLLEVEWFVYVGTLANQEASVIPSTQLNTILDALVGIMEPNGYAAQKDAPERNTLGGLVESAKIAGTLEDFEGDLGDLGVLIIPVEIMVPF